MGSEIISNIFGVISQTLVIYSYLLIIRVLLTWFPNLDWSNPILSNLSAITDPYLNLFRGIIPPIAGIDISPILAFLLLNFAQSFVNIIRYASLNNSIQFYG
ncbi:YggT family protein [Prochlorococcus sp. MIT 1223]|uniref:YggT family protein n=1 Tax=Prochlorococcus sp. MIT 1223 TaxID=3096217 RepID=UPI002A75D5ED|nr:YggT family protein [Prochlorococcus sp. MIT 1223]|tara:strand:- start:215 stop:520 length:306 start_codon:yes stop_codon:yes gene_type:complete